MWSRSRWLESEAAYDDAHLPGVINVPGALTPELAAQVAPTAAEFERLGYVEVRVYRGGKVDWFEAGVPLEGRRAPAARR